MTTTILIIIRLHFSCGDAITLSSALFIHNIWPYGIVLANIFLQIIIDFNLVLFETLISGQDTALTVTTAAVNTLEKGKMPLTPKLMILMIHQN